MKANTSVTFSAAVIAAAAITCSCLADQGQSSPQNNMGQQQSGQHPSNTDSQGRSSRNTANAGGNQSSRQQAPEGFVLIREDVVYLMANEPQNHLMRAVENLSLKNKQKAAGEIDVAASYIDSISSQNNGGNQQSLSECADKLRQTAKDVRDGKISDPQQLSQKFATTELALADYFQKSADQALDSHKQVKAGYDLRAAAMSLEQALAWSQQSPDQTRAQAIQDAQRAAASLLAPVQNSQSGQSGQTVQSGQSAQSTASGQQAQPGRQEGSQAAASGSRQNPQQASEELARQIDSVQAKIANGNGGNEANGRQASEK